MSRFLFFTGIVLINLIFAFQTSAQETGQPGTLTLNDCIAIAQDKSPVAKAAKYALIASKWRYKSFQAELLPSFSLSGNAPNFNKNIFSNVLDDGRVTFSSRTQSEASASLSLNQNITATGGSISVTSGISRLGVFANENTYLWSSTPLVLGLNQPIFDFNRLKWQKRLEPLQYRIAKKEYAEEMEDIALTVTQRFFDTYLARINLENARFNVTRNDSIYNISRGRYNVGSIAENDLLQAELALRNAEANLTDARIAYNRSLNEFKILLGFSTDKQVTLAEPPVLEDVSVDSEKAVTLAFQNSSEALNYELNERRAHRDLDQAKSDASFNATLSAQYGLNQTSGDFSNLYDDPQNRQFITVGFDVPIFNWGKNRAQINAAKNQQQEVANSIDYQRDRFTQRVRYTVNRFSQLRNQVLLAKKSDEIARRRYNVAQNRYMIGKIDITNLFIAQNEKDSARQSYIQALRNYWTGWFELRRLTLYDFRKDRPITHQF